ncbi:MAG: sulfatase-like hydrolase/transferase [Cyclobacteriaceae bacterium]
MISVARGKQGGGDGKESYFQNKPNIVFLLADDMGYGELGCYGQNIIKTPFLDSLSLEGMKFSRFYANAVCSPSRAALMTGKHPGHTSIRGNSAVGEDDLWYRMPLRRDEITMGEYFKSQGYKTGIIGKWHLENPDSLFSWAHERGFDYTLHRQWNKYGGLNIEGSINQEAMIYESGEAKPLSEVWTKKYVSRDDFRTDKAIDFINKYEEDPFFLFMSYKIPHTPENDINDSLIYKDRGWPEIERQHAGRITILDSLIGKLYAHLEDQSLLDNTIFVFTSDNGPHNEGGHDHTFFDSNGPYRGFKRDFYEGGIRVPLIAYWKDHIIPGSTSNHIATLWDLFPTFIDAIGGEEPDGLDGISFLPELMGQPQKEHEYLYWELQLDGWWQELSDGGFRQAILKNQWKAIRYGVDNPVELYNLEVDPAELRNVAQQNPQIIKEMEELFRQSSEPTKGFPYGGKKQNYKAMDAWLGKK